MADTSQLKQDIRTYILDEFLPGEPADSLEDDTQLVGDGILSSIDTLKLITHLEDTYNIKIESHEVIGGPLHTVDGIVALVTEKTAAG
jgi:acyl carrier protein